jgi:hypothetical protein
MTTRPRETQVPIGPVIAAIGAIVLIVSLFLDWYDGLTAFTVFEFLDLLLTALALVMLMSLVDALGIVRTGMRPGVPLAVAVVALLIVLSQLVNDPPAVAGPDGRDQDIGIWLALGGSALMVAGAVLSTARIAIAVEPRERRPRPGPPPAPPATSPPPPRDASEEPTIRSERPPTSG